MNNGMFGLPGTSTDARAEPDPNGVAVVPPVGGSISSGSGLDLIMENKAYVLPNFSGKEGYSIAFPTNANSVPATVTTSDGWILTTGAAAGTFELLATSSTATPHGTWGTASLSPPVTGAIVAAGNVTILATVLLADDVAVIAFEDGTSTFLCAANPVTGALGTPVNLGAYQSFPTAWLYRESATNFMAFYNTGTPIRQTGMAGSVAGVTITPGTPVTDLVAASRMPVQLTPGSYVSGSASNVTAWTVVGITVTKGAPLAVTAANFDGIELMRVSTTTAVIMGTDLSGPPSRPAARVLTITGLTLAVGAIGVGSADLQGSGFTTASPPEAFAPGGPFLISFPNFSVNTSGSWYAFSVSGTTVTFGPVLTIANTVQPVYPKKTFIHYSGNLVAAESRVVSLTSTSMLLNFNVLFVMQVSGLNLVTGVPQNLVGSSGVLYKDALTKTHIYAVGSGVAVEIAVTGNSISVVETLPRIATIFATVDVNEAEVRYGTVWHKWTLPPRLVTTLSPTIWLEGAGSPNLRTYGPVY